MDEFIKFNDEQLILNEQEILEYEMRKQLKDEELTELIINILKIDNIQNIQSYPRKERNETLEKIIKIKGTGINQISRVLGINKKVIQKVSNKIKKEKHR